MHAKSVGKAGAWLNTGGKKFGGEIFYKPINGIKLNSILIPLNIMSNE